MCSSFEYYLDRELKRCIGAKVEKCGHAYGPENSIFHYKTACAQTEIFKVIDRNNKDVYAQFYLSTI